MSTESKALHPMFVPVLPAPSVLDMDETPDQMARRSTVCGACLLLAAVILWFVPGSAYIDLIGPPLLAISGLAFIANAFLVRNGTRRATTGA